MNNLNSEFMKGSVDLCFVKDVETMKQPFI